MTKKINADRSEVKLRLREIMTEKGYTSRTLAEKLGTTPAHVNNALRGDSLSLNVLLKLAKALDVPFGDIFESSFTGLRYDQEFHAQVVCSQGKFTANSLYELESIVDSLKHPAPSASDYLRCTLNNLFNNWNPSMSDLASHILLSLSIILSDTEWRGYKAHLKDIVPVDFTPNYDELKTYNREQDVERLKLRYEA